MSKHHPKFAGKSLTCLKARHSFKVPPATYLARMVVSSSTWMLCRFRKLSCGLDLGGVDLKWFKLTPVFFEIMSAYWLKSSPLFFWIEPIDIFELSAIPVLRVKQELQGFPWVLAFQVWNQYLLFWWYNSITPLISEEFMCSIFPWYTVQFVWLFCLSFLANKCKQTCSSSCTQASCTGPIHWRHCSGRRSDSRPQRCWWWADPWGCTCLGRCFLVSNLECSFPTKLNLGIQLGWSRFMSRIRGFFNWLVRTTN